MNRLIEFFARQSIFANLLTIFVMIFGLYSFLKIRREVFPNINFDVITVTTALPGASAESVERLITNPLEQDLREVDGIKKMTSVSADNQSVIVLQLDPDQTTEAKAKNDIEDVVDNFRDLPEGAEDPIVTALESKKTPTVEVSLSGDVPETVLRETAKILERKIEAIRQVAKVQFNGLRDYEIRVEAKSAKLQSYQVALGDLINALKAANISIPGGPVDAQTDKDLDMIIRTSGEFVDVEDVKKTVIRANSLAEPIRIADVANVTQTLERPRILNRTNGKTSVGITVLKKETADAIDLVDNLNKVLEEAKPDIAPGIDIRLINDTSYWVKRRLAVLNGNLGVGLILVLIILGLVLPFRIAALVAIGIPFTFLGTMAYFFSNDIGLNLISMMGLIIVVGMLVDDAVVVTENCQAYIEKGLDPMQAAIVGTQKIWAPLAASVMTTVAAFLPLMFMSGIFGKFIQFIPLGVIVALVISLIEAYFILPNHFATLLKNNKKPLRGVFSNLWTKLIEAPYDWTVRRVLKFRYLVLLGFFGMIVGTILVAKQHLSFVLFPKGAIEIFLINVETPIGTPLERTAELMRPVEAVVGQLPANEIKDYLTRVGRQQQDEQRSKSGSSFAQIFVYLSPETDRNRSASEIIDDLRVKVGNPPGIDRITFELQAGGPPVGKPVSIGVRGDEYPQIMKAVEEVKLELAKLDGVSDIQDTFIPGKKELQVQVNEAEAAASGLNIREIGTMVRAAFEGIVASSIKTLDEEVDIRVSLSKEGQSREALQSLSIPNQRGQLIPLRRVASIGEDQGLTTYEHEDNRRQVKVTAEIDTSKSSALEVNNLMAAKIKDINKNHPSVSFNFGGEDTDTKESMQSLGISFAFALMGILFILIMLYKSILQPFLVATTIPMGAIAVVWTFILHNRPMSFLGMIGLISLAGVIVNNAIVLLDFVNSARAEGLDRIQSIISAANQRIRAIFLTTATTVVGILPTAYGIGGLDPFVVPIALALGWGLFAGSIMTCVVFPAIVAVADDFVFGLKAIFRRMLPRRS
jgi:multidrug efflux pump subunit AcrB